MTGIPAITKVVTPIDFSDNAEVIIDSAVSLVAKLQAELHLIFVVQDFIDYSGLMEPQLPMPGFDEELRNSAQQRLDQMMAKLQPTFAAAGLQAVSHKVLAGDVAEEILDYATSQQANLIIMGTHGYKGLDKLLFGSVATKVVQSAPCPVLTINPYTCCAEDR